MSAEEDFQPADAHTNLIAAEVMGSLLSFPHAAGSVVMNFPVSDHQRWRGGVAELEAVLGKAEVD